MADISMGIKLLGNCIARLHVSYHRIVSLPRRLQRRIAPAVHYYLCGCNRSKTCDMVRCFIERGSLKFGAKLTTKSHPVTCLKLAW